MMTEARFAHSNPDRLGTLTSSTHPCSTRVAEDRPQAHVPLERTCSRPSYEGRGRRQPSNSV
ncbi:hypothetical protein E2C01_041315 [Portunus trituberculatus]|uniref:Uncharacterized protein n=1 Tax=Portunus trituberculatus TaxID=210409 RepID=A0A5B7FQ33_PORTR|nr:hypothetical protein [Portunus trituberculatus]